MNDFMTVIHAVLPIFVIGVAGIFFRRWNWLTEEADATLLKLAINVLYPALIFDAVVRNPALQQAGNLLLPPAIGFITVCLGFGVGWMFGKTAGLTTRATVATFAFCIGIYNYGYVPLPLAQKLFDRETVGVLFVHNLGVDVAFWTVGLAMLTPAHDQTFWKARLKNLLNPVVLSIIVAVALNALNAGNWLPEFVFGTTHMLGVCAVPVGLLLIGATMADHLHEFGTGPIWRIMFVSCVLRLLLLPILFLLLAKYLPAPIELKRVIVLQAAMPSAVFPILITRHYNGDTPTALRAVIATSALSLLTIPLWVRAGMKFVLGS